MSLVTWDEGQPEETIVDGVRVLATCAPGDGATGLRFLHPRWTSLVAALKRADATVYYHNCGECVTGQVALWCRQQGRRFVYSVAAQADCDARLPLMTTWRERVLYRAGLRRADRIIVQTDTQRRMLRDGFQLDSMVIPMPSAEPADVPFNPPSTGRDARAPVLWAGRICVVKRPDRFIELAAACPDLRFELVGPSDNSEYARDVLRRGAAVPNLRIVGRVAPSGMANHYRRALCLCCTSDFEGFPNTFLEAWCLGLPTVSTWDPDDIIKTRGLGIAAKSVTELATGLRSLAGSSATWLAASGRSREYFVHHHTVDRVMVQYEQMFLDASAGAAPPARVPLSTSQAWSHR